MKKIISRIVAAAALLVSATTAQAGPFQFGPVVGLNVNSFTVGSDVFNADNRSGFTGGVMAKFTVPIVNIGADLSVMYVRRGAKMEFTNEANNEVFTENVNYDYLAIPLHLRYDLSLPAISKFIVPYVLTGPNFAFRLGKDIVNDYKANKYNVSWDFGLGVVLIKHLQINAAYSLGMNKALSYVPNANIQGASIKGRTSGWTITAGWLF